MRSKVERHVQWWQRTNRVPLVGPYVPLPLPYEGLDCDVPPSQMAARALRIAEVKHTIPGDALVVANVNFSVAFVPALAGAGFHYDAHTSWSVPVATCAAELQVKPFDARHPLFQRYLERLQPLLDNWSWDTYLPGLADYLGPLDILAGMLGPENLAVEMLLHPQEVKRHAMDAAQTVRDMLRYELALHRRAGMTAGVTDAFQMWLPGTGVRMSEDFSALVGPQLFRDFFAEPDALIYESVQSAFLHVHSAAHHCMPAILACRNLGAIEFGNDPNGPDVATRIACMRAVQARGLALQLGSWGIALRAEDIDLLCSSLDPRGLMIRLQAATLDEARAMNEHIQSRMPSC